MAIDYDLARQQLAASSQQPPQDDSGMNGPEMSTITNALNQKGGNAEAAIGGTDSIQGLIKSNMGRTQQLADKYQKETDPLYADFDKVATSKHAEAPKYEDVLNYQDLQKSIMEGKKSAQDWGAAVGIVSALLGGVGKKHGLAGLSALTGGLKGLKEGSDATAKQQMELFKESNEAIKQHNETLNTAYNDILSDRKLSLEDMKQRILEKSLQFNDLLTAQQIQKGDIAGLVSFMKERDKKVASLQPLAEKIEDSSGNVLETRGLSGDKYLQFLKSANPDHSDMIDEIKAIGDYKQQPRVSRAGSKVDPQAEAIMAAVRKYNPDYDQTKWLSKSHYETSQAGALGRSEVPTQIGNTEVSIQKVNHHLDLLQDDFDKLTTGDSRTINSLVQKYQNEFGDPNITNAEGVVSAVSQEFHRVYVPTGGVSDERASAAEHTALTGSMEQRLGAIKTMKDLMRGQGQGIKTVTDTLKSGKSIEDLGAADATSPVPGAKQAPDGKFYVPDPNRPGKYLQVQ